MIALAEKVVERQGRRVLVEPLTNVWDDVPFQGIAREGGARFVRNKKPEKLLARIIAMSTDPGDWVLDAFLGSGTSAAVAHKARRCWIGIESGDRKLDSLCIPRLRRVVDGDDASGVTRALGWKGEGGFVFGRSLHLSWTGGVIALASLFACGRNQASPASGPGHAPATARAESPPTAGTAPTASSASPPSGDASATRAVPWRVLVGDERWNAAWRALEALPDAERARSEVRYVRARVALARGDATAVIPLLDGLETALPLLADDIADRRASAKLVVGPFEEAADWWAARAGPSAQLDAARAYEMAKDARRARLAADRVLSSSRHTRSQGRKPVHFGYESPNRPRTRSRPTHDGSPRTGPTWLHPTRS